MLTGHSAVWQLLAIAMLTGGCAATMERNPLPNAQAAAKATLVDVSGSRVWGDETPSNLTASYRSYLQSTVPRLGASAAVVNGRAQIRILALSGGGSDGAFGAGVLTGWTQRGDRPEFEHVTGVSAGAIIAPFAYLGADYDPQMKAIWTETHADQLVLPQILTGILGGESLADTGPLKALIARYVDRAFLKRVAEQYARGRILTIGTTNLDAKRPVVWNMGAIATHYDRPAAVQLFRDVIMASAAIPGLFPPVRINVMSDGKRYDEMHVDGGVTRQVYVNSVNLPFKAFDKLYDSPPQRYLYIVNNSKMSPDYSAVAPTTLDVASQSINALMLYQHKDNSYRIYRMARDDDVDFNSVEVPATFNVVPKYRFDLAYQRAVFEIGLKVGRNKQWQKVPLDVPLVPPSVALAAGRQNSSVQEQLAAQP